MLPIKPHQGDYRWGRYAPDIDPTRVQTGELLPFRFRYASATSRQVKIESRIEYDSATMTIETDAALCWRAESHVFIDSDLFVIRSVTEKADNSPALSRRSVASWTLDLEKVDNPWRARA